MNSFISLGIIRYFLNLGYKVYYIARIYGHTFSNSNINEIIEDAEGVINGNY